VKIEQTELTPELAAKLLANPLQDWSILVQALNLHLRVRKRIRCADEDTAWAELDRLRRTYGAGGEPVDGTLDEYLAGWLRDVRPTIAPTTWRSYSDHVTNHISPLLGGIPAARLRPADVRRLIADRLAAKSKRGKKPRPLSPATVARIVTTLRIALEAAVRDDSLPTNVAAHVRLPRATEHRVEPMTDDGAEDLIAAFEGHWLSPLVRLLAGSGLRLGEALSLDQGDALADERYVRIRKSKTTLRAVPVSADAAAAIRAAKAAAPRRGDREPLFFGPRSGDRLTGATVSHAVPRVIEAHGMGDGRRTGSGTGWRRGSCRGASTCASSPASSGTTWA